jgi:hypothetical protein
VRNSLQAFNARRRAGIRSWAAVAPPMFSFLKDHAAARAGRETYMTHRAFLLGATQIQTFVPGWRTTQNPV